MDEGTVYIQVEHLSIDEARELCDRLVEIFPLLTEERWRLLDSVMHQLGSSPRSLRVETLQLRAAGGCTSFWGTGETEFYCGRGLKEVRAEDVLSYNER